MQSPGGSLLGCLFEDFREHINHEELQQTLSIVAVHHHAGIHLCP